MALREPVFSKATAVEGLTYREAMYVVCHQALKCVVRNQQTSVDIEEIFKAVTELENLFSRVQPKIRCVKNAKILQDRIQHYSLRINSSFVIATLLRPSLSREKWRFMRAEKKENFAARCKYHLTEGLRAYVRLQSFTVIATRSWALTHNGLSSALLLAIIGETNRNADVRELQGQLIEDLTKATSEDGDLADNPEESPKIWGPHARALVALKTLHSKGVRPPRVDPGASQREPNQQETSSPLLPPGLDTEPEHSTDTESPKTSSITTPRTVLEAPNSASLPQSQWSVMDLLDFSPDSLFDSVLWGNYVDQPEQVYGFPL